MRRGRTVSDKEMYGLKEGERYSVTTEKDKIKGEFIGYTMIGNEPALVIQFYSGVTRFIMISRIIHIDLVGPGDNKKADDKRPESGYYG
jgi:hypothetical protein